jgi:ankyrin repeat protein
VGLLLLAHGADPHVVDGTGRVALHQAAASGSADLLQALLTRGVAPDPLDVHGMTPLHAAVGHAQAKAARLLLACGAAVGARDHYGVTPLHLATTNGDVTAMQLLLEHGADPNAVDAFGWTPLHVAAASRFGEGAVAALLAAGADATVRTPRLAEGRDGRPQEPCTARELAARSRNDDAVAVLTDSQ